MKLAEVRQLVRVEVPAPTAAQRALRRCNSVEDFRQVALRRLPRGVADYVEGGAEAELTLAENIAAFRRWRFQPRVLEDVSAPDLSVEVFGRRLSVPLGLAPTGYTRMMHPGGEPEVARGAAPSGLPYGLSTVGTTSVQDLAASGHPNLWFQLYMLQDRDRARRLVERAATAGYKALELSVDTAVPVSRTRDLRNGLTIPPRLTPATLLGIARHFGYWTAMLRSPMLTFANLVDYDAPGDYGAPRRAPSPADMGATFDAGVTWRDLEELRRWWPGPLLLKGPIGPEDARRAVDAGVDGLHLSNHGGRQLDRSVPTVDTIRGVREAVGRGPVIVVDSGVRHGADIVIALARGADMCMIGRAYLYALAAAGAAGVSRVIELLEAEVRRTLQLLGAPSVKRLREMADDLVLDGAVVDGPVCDGPVRAGSQPYPGEAQQYPGEAHQYPGEAQAYQPGHQAAAPGGQR